MNLIPLYEQAIQFNDYNGTVLAAGKVEVWYLGRTRKADIYSDVAGETPLPNPLDLNDLGMQEVYVNPAFNYTLVVYDPYGSELFSVDKYLQGAGAHTTSNVVVQPSEHIGVSAWTVGEVQIYQPYLTGQLGKVYTGIEPIVVNNVEDKISANHVPLGVQDPLYFVQDDEEGCIIGFSGETLPEGTMNESAFGYEDGKITGYNGSGFSAGLNYEAGSYVDIDGNTINVTGLQPAGNYQSAGDYVVHDELSSYATQDWVENQSYMKEYMESAFYPSTSNPSGYLTEHQDLSDYAKTEDLTAYQPVGNYYSASNPDGFINSDAISAMATTGFVADVSGDITGLIPSTAGLATENWVTSQGYLTEHQSLDGLMSADLLESSGGLITGYNGSAFAGQGGGVTGDFTLVEGNGIQLTDDPIAQTTTISVSGDYATNTQLQTVSGEITAMIPTALTGDYLDKASADTLYYPLNSNPSGYLTSETDWTNTITAASANAYNEATAAIPTGLATTSDLANVSADITAQIPTDLFTKASADTLYQPIGDYLTTGDSANFATTGDVEDLITSISETYQTTAGMTAYLTTGDSAEFMTTAERSDYIPTGVSSEFYTTANTANYISEVPDTYLQNTDLTIADNKVTEISGIPLSAGTELEFEYDAADNISAINNSAISTTPAQDLYAQSPLYFSATGTSSYMGINSADLARMLGVDETVLWSGSIASSGTTFSLSEDYTNFDKIAIYARGAYLPSTEISYFKTDSNSFRFNRNSLDGGSTYEWICNVELTGSSGSFIRSVLFTQGWTTTTRTVSNPSTGAAVSVALTKIIGIGRKEV